jgi:hypothetical protein
MTVRASSATWHEELQGLTRPILGNLQSGMEELVCHTKHPG